MSRLILLLALCAALAAPAAASPGAGSLGFEQLIGTNLTLVAHCNPDGNSHIQFEATGTAVGPYPGTFTERGELTIGPQPFPAFSLGGSPLEVVASFKIDSPATDSFVTGQKRMIALDARPDAVCQEFEDADVQPFTHVNGSAYRFLAPFGTVEYQAVIHTPEGALDDHGRADLLLDQRHVTFTRPDGSNGTIDTSSFRELLLSSQDGAS